MGRYFRFSGRMRRAGWWLGQLFVVLLLLGGLATVIAFTNGTDFNDPVAKDAAGRTGLFVFLPFWAAMTWINFATSVQRYHDRDKSGWWVLGVFAPIIGPFWLIFGCGIRAGTPGPNRYGLPPGSTDVARVFGDEAVAGGGDGIDWDAKIAAMKAASARPSAPQPAQGAASRAGSPVPGMRLQPQGGFGRRGL